MSDDHELPRSSNLPGGLLVRKDRAKATPDHPTSNPSRLGLDKLAQEKARERQASGGGAAGPIMGPPSKRPFPSGEGRDGEGHGGRQYRRPREETPSHAGGVNEAAAQRIKERVAERLRGDGQVFRTARGGEGSQGGGSGPGAASSSRSWVQPSPARSTTGSEWEAPSPMHPSLVPDRAAFGSEPRGFVADTPLDTPTAGLSGSRSSMHTGIGG
jgi:hypothetical protein